MKAIICKNYGDIDELEFLDVDTPVCKDNEVLISVGACGVNFPDTLIVQGKYQFKPNPPFSPGGEVSGVIKKIGANVENFKIGDKVIAFTTWGGFAEEISINQTKVLKIPDTFDLIDAAGFVLTYGTSYHALFDRAQFSEGETLQMSFKQWMDGEAIMKSLESKINAQPMLWGDIYCKLER